MRLADQGQSLSVSQTSIALVSAPTCPDHATGVTYFALVRASKLADQGHIPAVAQTMDALVSAHSCPDQVAGETHQSSVRAPKLADQGHSAGDTQKVAALVSAPTCPDHLCFVIHCACVRAPQLVDQSHIPAVTQSVDALVSALTCPDQGRHETHHPAVRAPILSRPPIRREPRPLRPGTHSDQGHEHPVIHWTGALDATKEKHMSDLLFDPLLKILATQVDDLEALRIASENRYRQLTRDELDTDEQMRGLGLPEDNKEVRRVRASIDGLASLEKDAISQLERHMRYSMWSRWLKGSPGVGEKSLARLLSATGDPYWNTLHDRPRQVSELWSYCGYGDAARQVKRKGQKVNWSPEAKKRGHIIALSCLKQPVGTVYRDCYVATRERYVEAVHTAPCPQCGPAGKPALPGSLISANHQHFRALRAVIKEVLRDLWLEARSLHEELGGGIQIAA